MPVGVSMVMPVGVSMVMPVGVSMVMPVGVSAFLKSVEGSRPWSEMVPDHGVKWFQTME